MPIVLNSWEDRPSQPAQLRLIIFQELLKGQQFVRMKPCVIEPSAGRQFTSGRQKVMFNRPLEMDLYRLPPILGEDLRIADRGFIWKYGKELQRCASPPPKHREPGLFWECRRTGQRTPARTCDRAFSKCDGSEEFRWIDGS